MCAVRRAAPGVGQRDGSGEQPLTAANAVREESHSLIHAVDL